MCEQRLVQSLCEISTSLELSDLLGIDLNLSLCGGIDTLTSGALADAERTEANKSNLVTCYKSVLHCYDGCLKSLLCVNLRDASTCCDFLY